jgi:hypothetical protein
LFVFKKDFYDGVSANDVIIRGPLRIILAMFKLTRGGKSPAINLRYNNIGTLKYKEAEATLTSKTGKSSSAFA